MKRIFSALICAVLIATALSASISAESITEITPISLPNIGVASLTGRELQCPNCGSDSLNEFETIEVREGIEKCKLSTQFDELFDPAKLYYKVIYGTCRACFCRVKLSEEYLYSTSNCPHA